MLMEAHIIFFKVKILSNIVLYIQSSYKSK